MVRISDPGHITSIKKRLGKKKKLALILAGGGITGATYEIGALQALDHAFDGHFSVTDFDIIIGLSAGSFVGALLANGVTPTEMFLALQRESRFIQVIHQMDIYYPNFSEVLTRPLAFPFRLVRSWLRDLMTPWDLNPYAYLDALDEILPSGFFSNQRIESYLRENLSAEGRTNDFRKLNKELYIAATDLDTGERVIFGDEEHRDTPISKAVQASTALPLFYKPVEFDGREYIDGAIRKSVHIDVALKRGADLVICINPLVPFYNDLSKRTTQLVGGQSQHLSEKGMVFIAHQVMRIMVHSRISSGLEKYRARYPHADILLIEPRPDDEQMFFYKLMKYSERISIARHGYEETLEALLRQYSHFKQHFRKHGIKLSCQDIRAELNKIRRVPPGSYGRIEHLLYSDEGDSHTADKLEATLDTLERQLAAWGSNGMARKAS